MEHITSSQNPRFKAALKLHSSRGRQKQGRIIVFGDREVGRAIEAGVKVHEIVLHSEYQRSRWIIQLLSKLPQRDVLVYSLADELFDKLGYGARDGQVFAICERPSTNLEQLDLNFESFVVVLESLEKPGNLGVIARSADGSGAAAIILADPLTDIFHPNAIRASVASVFALPIASASSVEVNRWLMEQSFEVVVVTPESSSNVFEVVLPQKSAFIFGNEAKGLSSIWRDSSHQTVSLPMLGIGDSLNVSVTASLLMYEARRQMASR